MLVSIMVWSLWRLIAVRKAEQARRDTPKYKNWHIVWLDLFALVFSVVSFVLLSIYIYHEPPRHDDFRN